MSSDRRGRITGRGPWRAWIFCTHARCVDHAREQMRVYRISRCDGEI